MKRIFILFLLLNIAAIQKASSQVNSISLSPSSATTCDSVFVSLSGNHTCPNDLVTGITHSVSGSVITINVTVSTGVCIPPIPTPTWSDNYAFSLSAIPVGSYSVNAYYNTILSSSSASLTVTACCPNQADAGNDTSLCDVTSFQLNANSVPSSATSNWSVISGTGSVNNATLSNALLSNLSYGANTLVWSTSDSICTTSDTIVISNFATVSVAITEIDRTSCEDTTTISANTPSVGTGKWTSLTMGGIFVTGNSTASTLVKFLVPNSYEFTWTIANGACISIDTLIINYAVLDSAPVISASNSVLTSSMAPQYQWYKDGIVITGANNMTYTATSNGIYKVLGSIAGCSSGLFSNEIELLYVGQRDLKSDREISIAPNPARTYSRISGLKKGEIISIYQNDMKLIHQYIATDTELNIDLSQLSNGLYYIYIQTTNDVFREKLLVIK